MACNLPDAALHRKERSGRFLRKRHARLKTTARRPVRRPILQASPWMTFEAAVALVTFLCLATASLTSLVLWPRLPERLRDDDTRGIVHLVANIFAMLGSLVLGLMVSAASGNFDDVNDAVHSYATEIILLDHALRGAGAEAAPVRAELQRYVETIVGMADVERPATTGENRTAEATLQDIGDQVAALAPPGPNELRDRNMAAAGVDTLVRLRWKLIDRTEGFVPFPLVVSMVLWFTMMMASYGFRSPRNVVVVASFLAASALLAGAIFLILDMGRPFDGGVQASSEPFLRALAEIKG